MPVHVEDILAATMLFTAIAFITHCTLFLIKHANEVRCSRFATQYGLTGSMLTVMGVVWVIHGLALSEGYTADLPGAPHLALPFAVPASIAWGASGGLALVAAVVPRLRTIALALLWVMPTVRFASLSWVCLGAVLAPFGDLVPGPGGNATEAAYGASHYLVMSAMVLVAALLHAPPGDER